MLTKHLLKVCQHYRVTRKVANDGPLPSMLQYFLHDDSGNPLSFWLDIPLSLKGDTVNCIVEIPKQKHGKFEVKKHIVNHPMMQDTRKNIFDNKLELRFYSQFPLFNYGYIPQTWQQNVNKNEKGLFGDDDPIDICDLTQQPKNPGDVFCGKILGSFCLIDQGEVDWKVLVIDEKEAMDSKVHSISDIDPQLIQSIKKWFKIVKVFDGKKANVIEDEQRLTSADKTIQLIKQNHRQWLNLVTSDDEKLKQKREKHRIKHMKLQDVIQ